MGLRITSPVNGAVVSGTITVSASTDGRDNGISATYLEVDGVQKAVGIYPAEFSLDTTQYSAGNHTLVVKMKQKGIIYSSPSVVINVQNDAQVTPTVTQSIANGSTISGTVTWQAFVSGITPVTSVLFIVDALGVGSDSSSPYSYSLDTTTLSNGIHTFKVRPSDSSGTTYYSTVTATVDNAVGALPSNTTAPSVSGTGVYAATFSNLLDDFNRVDENPLSQSGAWTTLGGFSGMKLVSNQAVAAGSPAASYRGSYSDVEVAVKLGTIAASTNDFIILVRLTDSGAVSPIRNSAKNAYGFSFDGLDSWKIFKFVAGTATVLQDWTNWSSGPLVNGDTVGVRAVGTSLEVWAKRGSTGTWIKEDSVTDSTHTGPGAISLGGESLTSTFDDYRGGNVQTSYQSGTTLTADKGVWTGSPTPTYAYQWLRCDANGNNGVAISGAISQTYTLLSADVGSTIRVRVTATNSSGSVSAQSAATNVIISASAPPPPPPPPPPVGTPLFDGQATRMNSITGSSVKVGDSGWTGNSTASQDPHIWGYSATDIASGVYFMTDSGSIVSDPTYGKVLRCNIGPGDTNPYFDQPTKPNGELTIARPITMGQVDWYSEAFKIVSPYTAVSGGFNVICQYGYPSLASPPLSISFEGTSLGIDRHVGVLQAAGDLTGATIEKPRFYTISNILNKWVEMVIGVKWTMDNTGWIEVWGRVKGNNETTFTLMFSHYNTVTFQQIQGQSIKTTVNDKMGLYFGTSSSPPTNTVLHRGFVRWNNKTDAINSMG